MKSINYQKHLRILNRTRIVYLAILILIVVLFFLLSPMISNESSKDERMMILEALRNAPLTVGQAISISEVILQSHTVPVAVVLAVIQVESEYRPFSTSSRGAKGLMQIREIVFNEYSKGMGLSFKDQGFDPVLNVTVGIKFLDNLYWVYGDWKTALSCYYTGSNNRIGRAYASKVLIKAKQIKNKMEVS